MGEHTFSPDDGDDEDEDRIMERNTHAHGPGVTTVEMTYVQCADCGQSTLWTDEPGECPNCGNDLSDT